MVHRDHLVRGTAEKGFNHCVPQKSADPELWNQTARLRDSPPTQSPFSFLKSSIGLTCLAAAFAESSAVKKRPVKTRCSRRRARWNRFE